MYKRQRQYQYVNQDHGWHVNEVLARLGQQINKIPDCGCGRDYTINVDFNPAVDTIGSRRKLKRKVAAAASPIAKGQTIKLSPYKKEWGMGNQWNTLIQAGHFPELGRMTNTMVHKTKCDCGHLMTQWKAVEDIPAGHPIVIGFYTCLLYTSPSPRD